MSDLLTHLREVACNGHPICDEAADEILNMEAKLQAAERENSVIRGEAAMGLEQLRNKLQAAEAEAGLKADLLEGPAGALARVAELEAEVARLTEDFLFYRVPDAGAVTLRNRIAELEATNQVLIATKISTHQATKAALEWAAINPWYPADQLELFEEYIARGLAALLGEGEK